MAAELFVDRLLIVDSIYVINDPKSSGERILTAFDFVNVSQTIDAVSAVGVYPLAMDGIQVKNEQATLINLGTDYINHFDYVMVLKEAQDFDLELSLLEKMPVEKTKRVVRTTFSPAVNWA